MQGTKCLYKCLLNGIFGVGIVSRVAQCNLHDAMSVFTHQNIEGPALADLGALDETMIEAIDIHKQLQWRLACGLSPF